MFAPWINIALAFVEGFALIISPCILPILPIILSGSLTGSKSRPIGIIVGFILVFTIVTLFSKTIIDLSHLDPSTIRNVSFIILLLLGVIMISTYLTDQFNLLTQRLTRVGSSMDRVNDSQAGFLSGILFGGLVGIVWTPCAGPILAAIIVQVVIQQTTFLSLLTVLAFAFGAGLPMLLIALIGRKILDQFRFIREHTTLFRKALGYIIIFTVLFLIYDSQVVVANHSTTQTTSSNVSGSALTNGLPTPYQAPEIGGITAWINSSPLQMSELKGKVVLIDFWTYSCINCIRTLPYLKDWYAKYHDKGLVIIGIHSPEFTFEQDVNNVKNAVTKDGILYPVALDNHFTTWRNYNNQYWPAHYLIDKTGNVVYVHFGEGEYDVTENNIRYLLGLKKSVVEDKTEQTNAIVQTPETYLGYNRATSFSSPETMTQDIAATYSYPSVLLENGWALKGGWMVFPDKIVAVTPLASIELHFRAANVYAVMGSNSPLSVKLSLNGAPVTDSKGNDVTQSQLNIHGNRLYSLLNFKQSTEGTLELTALRPGLEIYTFTFGS